MGNCSPVKASDGRLIDSRRSAGLARPFSANVSMGIPSCWACQEARAMLPLFSLPSVISATRGTIPAGREAMASRTAASRSVARPASPDVFARCQLFCSSAGFSGRVDRANGTTRTQLRPFAPAMLRANCEARSRSAGVALAEVSTSTATATFVSSTLKRGSASASRIATKLRALRISANLRCVRRHSNASHASGSQVRASTHAR